MEPTPSSQLVDFECAEIRSDMLKLAGRDIGEEGLFRILAAFLAPALGPRARQLINILALMMVASWDWRFTIKCTTVPLLLRSVVSKPADVPDKQDSEATAQIPCGICYVILQYCRSILIVVPLQSCYSLCAPMVGMHSLSIHELDIHRIQCR